MDWLFCTMFKNIKKDYLNIFIPLWKNEYYAGPYIFFVEIFGQSNNKPDISHNIQMRAIFCIDSDWGKHKTCSRYISPNRMQYCRWLLRKENGNNRNLWISCTMLVGHPGSAANLSEEPVEVFHGHQPILAVFNPEKSGAICCTKIS